MVKNLPSSAGDIRNVGSIPELRRFPGEGDGNLLQSESKLKWHLVDKSLKTLLFYKRSPSCYLFFYATDLLEKLSQFSCGMSHILDLVDFFQEELFNLLS